MSEEAVPVVSPSVVRVGLLGAAGISKQTWNAIHAAGHRVTYVGCRSAERATALIQEMAAGLPLEADELPKIGSYDDVVSSPEVDLVYIPLPVTQRDQWVRACVDNKKHVVGEKPPATSAELLREWVEALDAQQLLYMDGTMFSHGERIGKVANTVKQLGGPVKHVTVDMSFNPPDSFFTEDIRCDPALEPQGALGDVGWYCIRAILHVMDEAMPAEVSGHIVKMSDKGAILQFTGELLFRSPPTEGDNGVTFAQFFCGFGVGTQCRLNITTTKGSVQINDFAHPIEAEKGASWRTVRCYGDCKHHTEFQQFRDVTEETVPGEGTKQQRDLMWQHVGAALVPSTAEDGSGPRLVARPEARYYPGIAWKTQAVMDKLLESGRQSKAAEQAQEVAQPPAQPVEEDAVRVAEQPEDAQEVPPPPPPAAPQEEEEVPPQEEAAAEEAEPHEAVRVVEQPLEESVQEEEPQPSSKEPHEDSVAEVEGEKEAVRVAEQPVADEEAAEEAEPHEAVRVVEQPLEESVQEEEPQPSSKEPHEDSVAEVEGEEKEAVRVAEQPLPEEEEKAEQPPQEEENAFEEEPERKEE